MLSSNTSAVSGDTTYVEDVFSTYLYTGNSAARSISNGIDLSTKGGMVWIKSRPGTTDPHVITDTARGATKYLSSNTTTAETTNAQMLTAFNADGFSLGTNGSVNQGSTTDYASWTFRKQPKFFDVVTYTGTGSATTISHSLGATPGCIIVKRTDTTSEWSVYHRSLGAANFVVLNTTAASAAGGSKWNSTSPTDTVFSLGTSTTVNASGGTYVAYIFAHDAGGFGLTGTDNVISCGSFTSTGTTTQSVNLGYEVQYILAKRTDVVNSWTVFDNMRGTSVASNTPLLIPNSTAAESSSFIYVTSTATGFDFTNFTAGTYIYIAIRRGPMKVPTDATKVFTPATRTGDGTTSVNVTNATFPVDLVFGRGRSTSAATPVWIDRLRGATVQLRSDNTDAEAASTIMSSLASQTGWIGSTGGSGSWNTSSVNYIQWYFKRAPSFFDEVCYTGTGSNPNTQTHNLGAIPEFVIYRRRNSTGDWETALQITDGSYKQQSLNSSGASYGTLANAAAAGLTATTFNPHALGSGVNVSGGTYVAYLFATCPGVSKVGSYTGTGTTQQINCGFAAGARFVLIKRTDSTGDWYVWDSARGIVSGNDPYLLLNSTAAEVTSTDYIDTYSAGFELSSTAPAALNASGGTYIFLAIA